MWKLLLAATAGTLLWNATSKKDSATRKPERSRVAGQKRVFVSFAIEDEKYRDYLVKQSKEENSPFSFIDMSVKSPWRDAVWQEKCRAKIAGCDGLIVLLSRKTWHASGARWEIRCAKQLGVPVVGMHIFKQNRGAVLPELGQQKIISWTWANLEKVIREF